MKWLSTSTVCQDLVTLAKGTMRRGLHHGVEGSYGRVYQAQSVLTAHLAGDSQRYDAWIDRHANDPEVEAPENDGYYSCPNCNNIV